MLYDPASHYPDEVDPMVFFQDNDLEKTETINHYENLIAQGKYTEANAYMDQQEGIYGYFADFFNALENRIHSLQDYLLKKEEKQQPFIYYDGDDFPLAAKQVGTNQILSEYVHNTLSDYEHKQLSQITNMGTINKNIIWI